MKDSRIDRAVGLCKKLVAYFSHSWKRRRELAVAQKELNLPKHKLKTECPTRWGSRQAMVWSRGSLNSKLLSDMFSPLTGRLDTWHQPGRISKSLKWSTKRSPHWQTLLMLCQESIMLLSPQSSQSSTFLRQWWQCRKMIQISHDQ